VGGRALRLGQVWNVAVWEIAHLGSCHLGKYAWEVASCEKPLGKYLTSVQLSSSLFIKCGPRTDISEIR